MTATTMTSKGQMTVPKAIRDRLGLRQGDRLLLTVDRRGRLVGEPVRKEVPMKVDGMLAHLATGSAPTVRDMDEAVGRILAEKYRRATRR